MQDFLEHPRIDVSLLVTLLQKLQSLKHAQNLKLRKILVQINRKV